ncbi:MAG TPA: hypothetical protein VLA61_01655 [Ideonella sp.]|uniref:hypothetical protein n=1 Tax=Ideonella sp. TaxID=1929293 RepID=UPI002D0346A7|nr:hypothetical protein [Ideonella sp.]HSI46955.1 hypothetical protein [Ideonella sp.]
MRKQFAIFALLLGCLFMVQSSLAMAAVYRGCCLEDCKGQGSCVDMSCQACQVPAAAPAQATAPLRAATAARAAPETLAPSPEGMIHDVWRPPDVKTLLI